MRPILFLFALLLAACEMPEVAPPSVTPEPRPVRARPAPPPPGPSLDLARYYRGVQEGLVARGLLRTDGGGPDTPFDADDLVRNFERIALFEEYATVGGRIVALETESQVHKWVEPVRIELEVGAGVDPAKAARDRAAVEAYAERLAAVSRHPIRTVASNGNFHVLILTEDDRRAIGPRLARMIPGISKAAVETVVDLPRQNYCLVFALDRVGTGVYTQAVAVIRAEHPELLRLSCIHEEIAQGLGLSNDSPLARPSIFNDDEEFGLLTTHDEYLLRILYDPRIRPGMSGDEALPIVREIAYEILPAS
ncbi:DUF2927 domain-containing protein [Roseitranquillus sediminis]|uniref:DUF2927 domain-containing protein n=1 Tax=Roseitranquillus sediminis TaxID=2809051 RepID=UPI001D0C22FB|nr:DUF2927 domain-containing protein [Roseitranquillus sediminis]MBM9594792.1 DUF2927 domain-containing protein [Roseitranquillus sediminis]